MAHPSGEGKNYVTLEVQLWFDAKTGKVHVTSSDKDLPKGMHTTFRGVAAIESQKLLAKYGKPNGVTN